MLRAPLWLPLMWNLETLNKARSTGAPVWLVLRTGSETRVLL